MRSKGSSALFPDRPMVNGHCAVGAEQLPTACFVLTVPARALGLFPHRAQGRDQVIVHGHPVVATPRALRRHQRRGVRPDRHEAQFEEFLLQETRAAGLVVGLAAQRLEADADGGQGRMPGAT